MSAPGRYRARICADARAKFAAYRERNNIHPSEPFQHSRPLWLEAYDEALDAINYAAAGRHETIRDAAFALAEACLDVGEPGWRDKV